MDYHPVDIGPLGYRSKFHCGHQLVHQVGMVMSQCALLEAPVEIANNHPQA
jgi:hypothetical protein